MGDNGTTWKKVEEQSLTTPQSYNAQWQNRHVSYCCTPPYKKIIMWPPRLSSRLSEKQSGWDWNGVWSGNGGTVWTWVMGNTFKHSQWCKDAGHGGESSVERTVKIWNKWMTSLTSQIYETMGTRRNLSGHNILHGWDLWQIDRGEDVILRSR